MKVKDTGVFRLFENGKFTAFEFEEVVKNDSKLFYNQFFEEKLFSVRHWIHDTRCESVVKEVYSASFMFGACYIMSIVGKEKPNVKEAALIYRPRLFTQLIAPNRELTKWIGETNSIDFFYQLYELSFAYGAEFVVEVINRGQWQFEM